MYLQLRNTSTHSPPRPGTPVLRISRFSWTVLGLRVHRAGALAQGARGSARDVHADRDGRQPRIQVFRMPVHRRALKVAAEIIAGSILTGAAAEPIDRSSPPVPTDSCSGSKRTMAGTAVLRSLEQGLAVGVGSTGYTGRAPEGGGDFGPSGGHVAQPELGDCNNLLAVCLLRLSRLF